MTLTIAKADFLQAVDKALSAPTGQQLTEMAANSAQSSSKIVVQGVPGGSKEVYSSGQMAPARENSAPLGRIVIPGAPGGTKVISPQH